MHSVEPPPMSITSRSSSARRRLRVGNAEVDQAGLLAAGHDFDRMAERGFGRHQEGLRLPRAGARCWSRSHARAAAECRAGAGRSATGMRARARRTSDAARPCRPGLRPGALSRARRSTIAQLPEHVARHHHVETVGAQVDRGEQVAVLQRQRGRACEQARVVHVLAPHSLASSEACAECGMSSPRRDAAADRRRLACRSQALLVVGAGSCPALRRTRARRAPDRGSGSRSRRGAAGCAPASRRWRR